MIRANHIPSSGSSANQQARFYCHFENRLKIEKLPDHSSNQATILSSWEHTAEIYFRFPDHWEKVWFQNKISYSAQEWKNIHRRILLFGLEHHLSLSGTDLSEQYFIFCPGQEISTDGAALETGSI